MEISAAALAGLLRFSLFSCSSSSSSSLLRRVSSLLTSSFFFRSFSSSGGLALGLSGVTRLGRRLPGNREGLLGEKGREDGGGGDLDLLDMGDFGDGFVELLKSHGEEQSRGNKEDCVNLLAINRNKPRLV